MAAKLCSTWSTLPNASCSLAFTIRLSQTTTAACIDERHPSPPKDCFQISLFPFRRRGESIMEHASLVPESLKYDFLSEITDGFSENRILGIGGFGRVYKGVNKDGNIVAVKVFRNDVKLQYEQFKEYLNLASLRHQNIVQLVGYCHENHGLYAPNDGGIVLAEQIKRALCFEYMENGSLKKYLDDESSGLDWRIRYVIIRGLCNGLKYLHEELKSPICHLDLKPDNVLLDKSMIPKIADFGLSRHIKGERTLISEARPGTFGYMPPEYIHDGVISNKFDIFSLGVTIIQIMAARKGYSNSCDMSSRQFVELVHGNWRNRIEATSPDKLESYSRQVRRCLEIALKCVEHDRHKRPSIGDIIDWLSENETTDEFAEVLIEGQEDENMASGSAFPRSPTFSLLKKMINGISEIRKLGSSAYGEVYMAVLDGKKIAVRMLADIKGLDDKQINEYLNLAKVEHPNIVRLNGFYQETLEEYVPHDGEIVYVTKRVLCFEYMKKGSLEKYLSYESSGHDWHTSYAIIKGICEGLKYLHEKTGSHVYHMDLKTSNILLDHDEKGAIVPKIANLGLSRLYGGKETGVLNASVETTVYNPLECTGGSTNKLDIFSLGVVIKKIMTKPFCYSQSSEMPPLELIEKVQENWRSTLQTTSADMVESYSLQARRCMEIALSCLKVNMQQRPSIDDIIKQLNETESMIHIFSLFPHALSTDLVPLKEKISSSLPATSELLDVHPRMLRFPFEPNKLISCPLYITNKTSDHHVAFRCILKPSGSYLNLFLHKKSYFKMLSEFRGIIPPRSNWTYVLTMEKQQHQPVDMDALTLILESCICKKDMRNQDVNDSFFRGVRNKNEDDVHEVTLVAVCEQMAAGETITIPEPDEPRIKIIYRREKTFGQVMSIDVHPTEPWILAGCRDSHVYIWNYNTQYTRFSSQQESFNNKVNELKTYIWCRFIGLAIICSTKFIARKHWFAVGDGSGCIHVHSCLTSEVVKKLQAHEQAVQSLAVHPSRPIVLSATGNPYECEIKLWNWETAWECIRIFKGHRDGVHQVMFNPEEVNNTSFASVSSDRTLKMWDISSPNSMASFDCNMEIPGCVDYISVGGDRQCVVTGTCEGTASIWDLQTGACIARIEGLQEGNNTLMNFALNNVGVVDCPKVDGGPILVRALPGSVVSLCNSTTYRHDNRVHFNLGKVHDFVYIERTQSLAIAFDDGIAVMELRSASKGNN